MRLSVSNIAWDPAEDEVVADLLQRFAINAIDVAPGKYFPDLPNTTSANITHVKGWWADRGIDITGMQALLFGTRGLNVFGSPESQTALLEHLTEVCRIGLGLSATRLVFGSPKNRDRSRLNDQQTVDAAVCFFTKLGDIAQRFGVIICLEPNPPCYSANFMTTSIETAFIVERVAHPSIKMQLDTGALTINGEDPTVVLKDYASLIGHLHASEPDLLPLGDGCTDHEKMAGALKYHLPEHIVTIEMLATKYEPHEVSIERALKVATKYYRY